MLPYHIIKEGAIDILRWNKERRNNIDIIKTTKNRLSQKQTYRRLKKSLKKAFINLYVEYLSDDS
jgi:uncharacterized membrane protein YfbV (UPF0208 family)